MKRIIAIIGCFLLLVASPLTAQELTSNAEYKACMDLLNRELLDLMQVRSKIQSPYFGNAWNLEQEAANNPENRDSLLALATEERKIAQIVKSVFQEWEKQILNEQQTLSKYNLVYKDAFPYWRMRKHYSKDSLAFLLNNSSAEIRRSDDGKALNKFIKSRQIEAGEQFQTFRCYNAKGKRFDWSKCKGKKVFLVHDGLWCMNHGSDKTEFSRYLHHLFGTSRENWIPLIVLNCKNKEDLNKTIEEFNLQDFFVVSEFRDEYGTLNWLYNDQATPTCHYVDENGILLHSSEGIDPDYLEKGFLNIK